MGLFQWLNIFYYQRNIEILASMNSRFENDWFDYLKYQIRRLRQVHMPECGAIDAHYFFKLEAGDAGIVIDISVLNQAQCGQIQNFHCLR